MAGLVLSTLIASTALLQPEPASAEGFFTGLLTSGARLFDPNFCWQDTIFASQVPGQCAAEQQKIGLICYDKCPAGYTQDATLNCVANCPSGFHVAGVECVADAPRTVSRTRTSCPGGYATYPATCTSPPSTREKGCCELTVPADPRIPDQCASPQVKDGAICYSACRDGYYLWGGSCYQRCPSGYNDIGELCSLAGPSIFTREMAACPAGYVTEPLTCRLDYIVKGKPARGADLCYTGGCEDGFNDQWCTCARNANVFGRAYLGCPAGYHEFLASCVADAPLSIWKDRYLASISRFECAPGETRIADLCYSNSSGQRTVCGAEMCQPGERSDGCVCTRYPVTIDRPSTACPDGYYASTPDYCEMNGSRQPRDIYPLLPKKAHCADGTEARLGLCYQPCTANMDLTLEQRLRRSLSDLGIPERIESAADIFKLILLRYVSGHGWVAFKGIGYTLANVIDPKLVQMFGYTNLQINQPLLLMYQPVNATSDAQLKDMEPDYPYKLVGVGWMKDYKGTALSNEVAPEGPPTELDAYLPPGKFPKGSWLRHPAGCHMSDGSFVPFRENVPAPGANMFEDIGSMAKGSAWCQAIGVGSTWKPDGELRPGAPGKCLLARNYPASSNPRPIVPGSVVVRNAPALPGWPASGAAPAALQQALLTSATAACQKVGEELHPPMLPSLWHPSLWVTHVFFNAAGPRIGMMDPSISPYGYEGQPESFVPMTRTLISVGTTVGGVATIDRTFSGTEPTVTAAPKTLGVVPTTPTATPTTTPTTTPPPPAVNPAPTTGGITSGAGTTPGAAALPAAGAKVEQWKAIALKNLIQACAKLNAAYQGASRRTPGGIILPPLSAYQKLIGECMAVRAKAAALGVDVTPYRCVPDGASFDPSGIGAMP